MALRTNILASGVFLLSAFMVASAADSRSDHIHVAKTAYPLFLISHAEAHEVPQGNRGRSPRTEAEPHEHPDASHEMARLTNRPSDTAGQEIVFASSRMRWPQISYGRGGEKSDGEIQKTVGRTVVERISIAALLPAPHVATREIGSVVECVSQAVAGEARGEADTGQVGVANVIVNRLKTWGGSYCARVYDRRAGVCQFDGACHRYGAYTQDVAGRARTVALAAVTGQLHDVTGGALYFRVCQRGSERDPSFTVRIQNHCYFRDIPGLSRKDAMARSREVVRQVKERTGAKEVYFPPVAHVDYAIIPDKNGIYGFRVSEMNRT